MCNIQFRVIIHKTSFLYDRYFSPVPVKLLACFPNSENKWTDTLPEGNLAHILVNLLNEILVSAASSLFELQMRLWGETAQEAKDRNSIRSHTLLSFVRLPTRILLGGWIVLCVSNLRAQLGEPKWQFQEGTAPETCFCRWQRSQAAVSEQQLTLRLGRGKEAQSAQAAPWCACEGYMAKRESLEEKTTALLIITQ